jgi:lactate permease
MNWTQIFDPLHNIALSAVIAALPILFIFWALIIKKMKGYLASMLTVGLAILIAIFIYKMPVKLALLSTGHGALYGLFPICWIIITAVFLYNISVKSGQFEVIRNFMATITSDRRLQALLIAFSFGSFLEGTAGMGTPVAITAAMLVGLGFNPLYAAGICLIANTAPVAFGGVGIPITVASQVSGIPEMAISQMIGRTLPFLSIIVPFYLVVLMSGFKKSIEVLPAILVSGISFAFFQWFSSNYMSPMLPDVLAGLASIICLMILLKFWKPKSIWRFSEEPPPTINFNINYTSGQILKAWSPFIVLTVVIIAWGLQPVKDALNSFGLLKFDFPGLHNKIINGDSSNSLIAQTFKFNYLSASGTAIIISAFISIALFKMKISESFKIFIDTLKQLKYPIITIASVLGFAYIANNSGMSITMAKALTNTGFLYPFFAPVLGWLGVFLTGSDTSSNALFGKLQSSTASGLGIDPVITVSANASGGVTGKMISPQSIAVGAAAVGLAGKESDLFRFTFKHSFIFLVLICILTLLQAYVIKWIVPVYQMLESNITAIKPDVTKGLFYLLIVAIVLFVISFIIIMLNRKKKDDTNSPNHKNL